MKKNDNNFFNFTMRIAYFSLNPSTFAITQITQCLYQDDQIYYVTKFNRHIELGLPVGSSDKSVVMWAPLSPAGLKTWERQKFHHWWMKLPAKIQNRNPPYETNYHQNVFLLFNPLTLLSYLPGDPGQDPGAKRSMSLWWVGGGKYRWDTIPVHCDPCLSAILLKNSVVSVTNFTVSCPS